MRTSSRGGALLSRTASSVKPPQSHFFAMPRGVVWDRCEVERRSSEWLETQRRRADAKVALMREGKIVVRATSGAADVSAGVDTSAQRSPDTVWWDRLVETSPASVFSTSAVVTAALDEAPYFLAVDDARVPFFVASWPSQTELPSSAALVDARRCFFSLDPVNASRLAHGYMHHAWHASARFCGYCGGPTKAHKGGAYRQCTSCGKEVYPRTNPVAIMLVESPDGKRLLLGQSKVRSAPGMYSVLAGFIDQMESLEDAVRREVMEEAGVPLDTIRFHSSQPWPFPGNLMLGCECRAASETIRFDTEEMVDVRWFTRAEVEAALAAWPNGSVVLPPSYAIAHHLIQSWLARQREGDAQAATSKL